MNLSRNTSLRTDWLPDWLRTGTPVTRPSDENASSHGRRQDHSNETMSEPHGLLHDGASPDPSNLLQNNQGETLPAKDDITINNPSQNGVYIQPGGDTQRENHPLDNLDPNGIAIQPAPAAILIAVDPDRDRSVKRRLRGIHLFVYINDYPTVIFVLHS